MGCNDYNLHLDSSSGEQPTPEFKIYLDGVGVNGYSPTVDIVNENTASFQIQTNDINGTELTSPIPKLDYITNNYVSNTSLASTLAGYLQVNGSNATTPFWFGANNDFVITRNSFSQGHHNLTSILTYPYYNSTLNLNGLYIYRNENDYRVHLSGDTNRHLVLRSDTRIGQDKEIATVDQIPTVSDATITLTQGGVTKGTFTLNGSATTIDLDEGGSSIANPLEIVGEPYGDYNAQQKITIKAGTGSGSLNDIELGLKPISSGGWLTTSAYLISQINNPLSISNASALGRTLSLNYNTDTLELDADNYLNVKDVFLNKDGSNATNNFKIHNTELTQYSVDISNVKAGGFSVAHANNDKIYARLAIDNSKGSLQLPSISIASYPYSGTLHSNHNEISAYGDIIITNGASYKLYYGTKNANNEVAKVGDIPTTMVGADGTNAGSAGLVPAPAATDNIKFLCGDGTWKTVSSGTTYTAGTGIDITNDVISVDNTVAMKTDIPSTSNFVTTNTAQTITANKVFDDSGILFYDEINSINRNGITYNESVGVYVGDTGERLLLQGKDTHPYYNNNSLALSSEIPDVSNFVTNSSLATTLASYVQSSSLATVATTGNYTDLNGRPNLNAYVTLDTTQTISGTKTFSSETHHTGVITFDSALLNPIVRGMSGSSYRNMIYRIGNDSAIIVGNSNDTIDLKGSGTRPTYNTNSLALYSDIPTVPTNISSFTNDSGYITNSALSGYATETWVGSQGYITGITSTDVVNALGYTPYNSSNPNGYTSNVGTVTSVNNTQPDVNGNVTINLTPTVIDGGNA